MMRVGTLLLHTTCVSNGLARPSWGRFEDVVGESGHTSDEQPMQEWFLSHPGTGPQVEKWLQYFEPYERHFAPFRNRSVTVVEVGVNNGGSLAMWRAYFGPQAIIIGTDLYNVTTAFTGDPTFGSPKRILIGDQGEDEFWSRFRTEVRGCHIVSPCPNR